MMLFLAEWFGVILDLLNFFGSVCAIAVFCILIMTDDNNNSWRGGAA